MSANHATNTNRHAVVIGGSMAGLMAAQVLTAYFDRVTIIERDTLPNEPGPRNGAPQARHAHVLLQRGQLILNELFPGLTAELVARGAYLIDNSQDVLWLNPSGWNLRYRSGLEVLSCSRDLLEWGVRSRLRANAKVHFIETSDVVGLATTADRTTINGVILEARHTSACAETCAADLVVDASGRNSKAPQWLTALGYPTPAESIVNAHMGYASRLYQLPPDPKRDWRAFYLQAAPPVHAGFGGMFQLEEERWIVTMSGANGHYPPTDEAGFLEHARTLRHPLLYETLKNATPLSPIAGYRDMKNRWRHYEQMLRRPENFIVVGDAVCAFNPVYGQGMTIAALGADLLATCLDEQRCRQPKGQLTGLAHHFHQSLAKLLATPWMFATSEDYRYPETEGVAPSRLIKVMHWYLDQLFPVIAKDMAVHKLFLETMHMLKSPMALFQPWVMAKVMWQALRHERTERPTPFAPQHLAKA